MENRVRSSCKRSNIREERENRSSRTTRRPFHGSEASLEFPAPMHESTAPTLVPQVAEELPRRLADALSRQIEEDTLDLPVLAGAAQRIMQMALDDSVDPVHLADAIRNDTAMAGHLLRIANSPLY